MAKEEVPGTAEEMAAAVEEPEVEIHDEAVAGVSGRVVVDSLTASTSLIGSANVGELEVSTSAVGVLTSAGDVEVATSAVGIIATKQNLDFRQGWVNDVFAAGDVTVSQGGSALVLGKSATLENAGAAAVAAVDVKVSRGWIGLLLAGKSEISDDSHVIIGTRAALIIAAALLGGFGLVALALVYGSGRVAREWNPKALGEWAKHKIPADWSKHGTPAEIIERIRAAARAA